MANSEDCDQNALSGAVILVYTAYAILSETGVENFRTFTVFLHENVSYWYSLEAVLTIYVFMQKLELDILWWDKSTFI